MPLVGKIKLSEDVKSLMHRSLCTKLALIAFNKATGQDIPTLKVKQVQALVSALKGDVLVTLPTGYGKSAIFELLPYFIEFMFGSLSAVIIACPLNAIILEKLRTYGDLSCHISTEFVKELSDYMKGESGELDMVSHTLSRFLRADFKYIIGHPEELLHHTVLALFKQDIWETLISHIIIDEAHCIVTWGESFRPDYQKLTTLRAQLCKSNVIAMTATATIKMKKEITKNLHFGNNFDTVEASPDRPNIMYVVKSRLPSTGGRSVEDSYKEILQPIFEGLKDTLFYPKTVVYTKLKWCGYAHQLASLILGPQLKHFDEDGKFSASVAQYHAPQTAKVSTISEFILPFKMYV